MIETRSQDQVPPKVGEPGFDWAAVYPDFPGVFVYTDGDGQTVGVPHVNDIRLPFQIQLRSRHEPAELCWARLEKVLTAEAYAVLNQWDDVKVLAFFTAWLDDANMTLGEFKRSSTS